jgi:DNA-binding NtrC family response regulator
MRMSQEGTPESVEDAPVHVLLVEDEPDLRNTLRYNLKKAGYHVTDTANGKDALEALEKCLADEDDTAVEVVISDVMMPIMDGIELAEAIRARPAFHELPLMFLTAKGEAADRVAGFRVGADDYLTKPFDLEELLARVQVQARRALTARKVRRLLTDAGKSELSPSPSTEQKGDLYAKVAQWEERFPALAAIRRESIVGQSSKMLAVLREVLMRAPGKDPVLVIGGTGSGKTGVAESLHKLGPRADGPFRVVNCAELAAGDPAITLGKLFGYGKGSGLPNVPKDGQPGLLEDLDGGVLFLDEIHRLPEQAQSMLLLPLEGRAFQPAVGKGEPREVDVKFIFATNVDLKEESQAGRFAFDLYQRLAQSQIRVPSLSERREDIPALARHFLDECKEELDLPGAAFAPSLMQHLTERDWPGNVRELRALVREVARRAAFELDSVLTGEHLPEAWESGALVDEVPQTTPPSSEGSSPPAPAPAPAAGSSVPGEHDDGGGFWNEAEMHELSCLRRHRFKIATAEQELGLSSKSRTLTNHLRGMCFKAMVRSDFDLEGAARLVVGREDEALLDRTLDRMGGYMSMVEQHASAHTTKTLFNNLPRDYRKFVEQAIERARRG